MRAKIVRNNWAVKLDSRKEDQGGGNQTLDLNWNNVLILILGKMKK